jgi:hypothetical protein
MPIISYIPVEKSRKAGKYLIFKGAGTRSPPPG